jgi:hypothetical protein
LRAEPRITASIVRLPPAPVLAGPANQEPAAGAVGQWLGGAVSKKTNAKDDVARADE